MHDIRRHMDLMEQQRLMLLDEGRREQELLKTYSEQIERRWQAEEPNAPVDVKQAVANSAGGSDAEKVLGIILSKVPEVAYNTALFQQWMLTRWLRDTYRLEDLPTLADRLLAFVQLRPRLEVKDLNALASPADLYALIEPHLVDGRAADSEKAKKRAMQDRMLASDVVHLIHDDAKVRILVPLSKVASQHWGKGTKWCVSATTSHNYFDSYNARGPLYFILFKGLNQNGKFAFHLPHDGKGTDFRNELDQNINLRAFFERHPEIMRYIGEEKLLPYADLIGADLFSDDLKKGISVLQAARLVRSADDVRGSFAQYADDPIFINEVLRQRRLTLGITGWFTPEQIAKADPAVVGATRLTAESFTALPDSMTRDQNFVHAVLQAQIPNLQFIAPMLTHEQINQIAASNISALMFLEKVKDRIEPTLLGNLAEKFTHSTSLKTSIPEWAWTPAVQRRYWTLKIAENHVSDLKGIPDEMLTPDLIVAVLSKHRNKIAESTHLLTPEIVRGLVALGAVEHIPNNLVTQDLFDAVKANELADSLSINREQYLTQFPATLFDRDTAITAMKIGGRNKFKDLPERFKRDPIIAALAVINDRMDNPEREYLTPEVVRHAFQMKPYDAANRVPLDLITAEEIERGNTQRDGFSSGNYVAEVFMRRWGQVRKGETMPPDIRDVVWKAGVIELGIFPTNILTPEIIYRRAVTIGFRPKQEMQYVPDEMLTPDLVTKITAEINYQPTLREFIELVPEEKRTSAVLMQLVAKHRREFCGYYGWSTRSEKRPFMWMDLFPRDQWSPEAVIAAINEGRMFYGRKWALDMIPENLRTTAALSTLIGADPLNVGDVSAANLLSEAVIIGGVEENWQVLSNLPPEKVSLRVAKAAFAKWGGDSQAADLLRELPKRAWTSDAARRAVRVWADLKDLPKGVVDDEVIVSALKRSLWNLRDVKNPVEFLNKHRKELKSQLDASGRRTLEGMGIVWLQQPKQFWSVESLAKTNLSHGYTYLKTEPHTGRVATFLMDPKGKFVAHIHTERGKPVLGGRYKDADALVARLKKISPIVTELLNATMRGYSASAEMDKLGIHRSSSDGNWTTLADARREPLLDSDKLQTSAVTREGDTKHAVWRGGKAILTLALGWVRNGRQTEWAVMGGKVIDIQPCLKHAADIYAFAKAQRVDDPKFELNRIGVIRKEGELLLVRRQIIGRSGDVEIWRGDNNYVGLFGPEGMISYAKLSPKGTFGTTYYVGTYSTKHYSTITKLFTKLEPIFKQDRNARSITIESARHVLSEGGMKELAAVMDTVKALRTARVTLDPGAGTVTLSFEHEGEQAMLRYRAKPVGTYEETSKRFRSRVYAAAMAMLGGRKPRDFADATRQVEGTVRPQAIRILTNPEYWRLDGARYGRLKV